MNWKTWPYWIKVGLIILIIFVILSLILIPFGWADGHPSVPYWFFPSLLGFFPAMALVWAGKYVISGDKNVGIGDGGDFVLLVIISIILSAIIYFLIGAIIGWIIGKIKNRD